MRNGSEYFQRLENVKAEFIVSFILLRHRPNRTVAMGKPQMNTVYRIESDTIVVHIKFGRVVLIKTTHLFILPLLLKRINGIVPKNSTSSLVLKKL